MEHMRLAALFSGAKDSTLAVYRAAKQGHSVRFLVTIVSENPDSYMYHTPNTWLTALQAEALGVPAIMKRSRGEKEKELEDLKDAVMLVKSGIDGVVVGAVASRYQSSRVERVCRELGLKVLKPLWGESPEAMWEEMLGAGFRIMIVSVSCEGLGREWLGRVVDRETYGELKKLSEKHRFHLSGEGGEFETLVLDCPMFRKYLEILDKKMEWDSETDSGVLKIKEARLASKDGKPGG
jgi:predicted ATP pyrophosphatase (TIGR00289 family)